MIGLFFKFSRFWSVRNVDLILLILLAPGLLMVVLGEQKASLEKVAGATAASDVGGVPASAKTGQETLIATQSAASSNDGGARGAGLTEVVADGSEVQGESDGVPSGEAVAAVTDSAARPKDSSNWGVVTGYIWLFAVLGLLLLRMLLDPAMVRRPLLEPNLSTGGLAFIGCSLFAFLMANVINGAATEDDLAAARSYEELISGAPDSDLATNLHRRGPGNALLHSIPSLVTTPMHWKQAERGEVRYTRIAKAMAIMSHLAVVAGVVLIGYRHFGNVQTGIGVASLYLMLPYTAQMTGRVDHVLPAALLVWAVLCYRRPLLAGSFIGLAIGVVYYPLFLLPLWISFYWQRGLTRFLSGVVMLLALSVLSLVLVSSDYGDFLSHVQRLFGIWLPPRQGLGGIWGLAWDPTYRFPVLAAFIALSGALALWPAQKNLGTLLSCSAAVMIATQFWHGYGGGLYMAWFLPVALLTIFRPNLEDRVALSVLGEGWRLRKRPQLRRIDRAA